MRNLVAGTAAQSFTSDYTEYTSRAKLIPNPRETAACRDVASLVGGASGLLMDNQLTHPWRTPNSHSAKVNCRRSDELPRRSTVIGDLRSLRCLRIGIHGAGIGEFPSKNARD
jgi:hypothetical protein